jgi:hypothetical protein
MPILDRSKSTHHMNSRLVLELVGSECLLIIQLLASEYEPLLLGWNIQLPSNQLFQLLNAGVRISLLPNRMFEMKSLVYLLIAGIYYRTFLSITK